VETLQPELEHRGRQTLHSDLGFCDKLNILENGRAYINNIITFLFYNTKISDNIAESGKVPRMLAAFPR
jgi:hypothetical protein